MDSVKRDKVTAQEEGIVLVLFGVLLLVIIIIVAMVVDHSRLSLALDTLQRTADASALSGAKRLNGQVVGWRAAKDAAVLAIKQNPILGVNPDELSSIILSDGPSAFDANNTIHPGSIGSSGRLQVRVERGVLWHDPSLRSPASEQFPDGKPGGYRFVSLETLQSETAMPIPQAVEGYLYGNAVRVTLALDSLATTFGSAFGALGFSNLTRTAIAVTHEDLELSIAPIAIPLCALRLNLDPYADRDNLELENINFAATCTRQGIATEADPKRELPAFAGSRLEQIAQNEVIRRRMGLTRFESFLRPMYAQYDPTKGVSVCYSGNKPAIKHNCKTLPLWSILGIPSTSPGEKATAAQVTEAFTTGTTASPGMYWASLESLRGFQINPGFANAIASSILNPPVVDAHNAQTTFYDEFTEPFQGNESVRVAKRHFPFIRTMRPACNAPGPDDDAFDPERRPCIEDDPATPLNEAEPFYDLVRNWPTDFEINGEPVKGRIIMDRRSGSVSRQPIDYTNPLCHHSSIPIDSLNSGADPRRHGVRRTLAAVISPGIELRPDGKPVVYCHAEGLFSGYVGQRDLLSVAPTAATKPVIVGFIPISIYDVGLQDLDRVEAFKPRGDLGPITYSVTTGTGKTRRTTTTNIPPPPNGWQRVSTPFWEDPASGERIVDRNPGELDVSGDVHTNRAKGYVQEYSVEHGEWEDCVERNRDKCTNKKTNVPGGDFLGIPYEYLQCYNFDPVFKDPQYGNVVVSLNSISADDCPGPPDLDGNPTSHPCIDRQSENGAGRKADEIFNILQNFLENNIPARDHTHCLPRKNIEDDLEIHDKSDPDYYIKPFDTNKAGMGCGGALFAPSCGPDEGSGALTNTHFLPGGVAWDQTTPALVAEDTPRQ